MTRPFDFDAPPLENAADALAQLQTLAQTGDSHFPLGPVSFLLGAYGRLQQAARVSLTPYRDHLHALGTAIRESGSGLVLVGDRASALRRVLFDRFSYRGDAEDYDNLANANLLDVIDRRRGLPVALAILHVLTARACGWRAYGIPYPGHVLIALEGEDGAALLDPFTGRMMERADLAALAERFRREPEPRREDLLPCSDRTLLLRLQNNLRSRLSADREPQRLLAVLETMLALETAQPLLWFEAAALRAEAGSVRAAIEAYRQALHHGLPGPERATAEAALAGLGRRLN